MIVTFGKYKNRHVSELIADKGYVAWLLTQDFIKTRHKKLYKILLSGEVPEAPAIEEVNTKIPEYLDTVLRPFQKETVQFLLNKRKAFNSLDMGLGKSITSIASVETANLYPALVGTTKSMTFNWGKEFKKWCGKYFYLINSEDEIIDGEDVYIINYDILSKRLADLKEIKFKSLILDECHLLKDENTLRTSAVLELKEDVNFIFALSGTPMINRPSELISQLKILDRLEDLGGWHKFIIRYCDGYQVSIKKKKFWDISGSSNLLELNQNLRSFMFRKTKAEVYDQLPERQIVEIVVELDNREEYDRVEKEFIEWYKQKKSEEEEFKAYLETLPANRRGWAILNFQQEIERKYGRIQELIKIEPLRQVAVKGKLAAAIEWIENFLESGEKLIVFCHHIEIQKALVNHFKCLSILGETSLEDRDKAVEKFQNEADLLMACSLKAASVGLTLTSSNNGLFLEFPWTPAELEQAISRFDIRMNCEGEKDKINVYYFLGKDTIDQSMLKLLAHKQEDISKAIDGEEIFKELILKTS